MKFRNVLLYQSAGFLVIMALSWFDEVIGLRSLIFGNNPYISDFRESALEMLFVLAVWFIVVGGTRRLLARMSQLEKYLRVCAWCHRVGIESEWVKLEEFMARKFETRTSHGICEDCLNRQRGVLVEMNQKQPLLPLPNLPAARRADELR
jgi:hypothetical protein